MRCEFCPRAVARWAGLLLLVLAVGAGASSQIKQSPWRSIHVNPEHRIMDHATYAWDPTQRQSYEHHDLIVAAIAQRLDERGYQCEEVAPEIYVAYWIEVTKEILYRRRDNREWRNPPGTDEPWEYLIWSVLESFEDDIDPNWLEIRQLVLNISFEDAETGDLLWEVEGTYPWITKLTEGSVDAAIADLLDQLPSARKDEK